MLFLDLDKIKYNDTVLKRLWIIGGCIVLLTVGGVVAHIAYVKSHKKDPSKQYPLLAKRLFQENSNDTIINFQPLRQQVKDYLKKSGVNYSFYFEYLFTGSNIRAGENNQLVGASLMKIPIVMDLYKAAEMGKINLDQEVTVVQPQTGDDPDYGNTAKLVPGQKINLREAAKIALTESDNTAAYTVFNAIQGKLSAEDQTINNLDVETRVDDSSKGKVALIDSRAYSSFLRCLYFSCQLSKDHSEEILSYLTDSTDNSRLAAGLPNNVKVAHKIGSFSTITQSDCGIVYVPDRRYMVCIMLDEDKDKAAADIKELSKIIYDYVTTVNAN